MVSTLVHPNFCEYIPLLLIVHFKKNWLNNFALRTWNSIPEFLLTKPRRTCIKSFTVCVLYDMKSHGLVVQPFSVLHVLCLIFPFIFIYILETWPELEIHTFDNTLFCLWISKLYFLGIRYAVCAQICARVERSACPWKRRSDFRL